MQILLREERFKSNVLDLNRRGYSDFIFVQIGNKRGFIVSKNLNLILNLGLKNNFMVTLMTEEKVPLYKQDMALRMGKKPEGYKEILRNYNVRVLDKCRDNYSYTVWSIV